jgi:tricorn protease
MRTRLLSALFFAAILPAAAQSLPSLSTPALSPDGKELAFASGGDLWTVPAAGGEAHLLVTDPADESRPLYSPDGTRIAFVSTRTGAGDIYVLTLATNDLQRITYSDAPDNLDAWSRDGKWLYFTSAANDVAGQGDIFRVPATGGTPLEVSRERYINEFESAPSPDGAQIAFVARGVSSSQWWRNGHAHIDETELWLRPLAAPTYKRLLAPDAKHAWPMWSADGRTLFFMSDKSGAENIWQADAATGSPKQITKFTTGRVLWPTIAYDGKTIVFERNFTLWQLDTVTGKSAKIPVTLRGAPTSPGVTRLQLSSWNGLALSPDGKKLAVLGHGEVFAASAKDGGDAQRLTHTDSAESDPDWSSDSAHVAYRSERDNASTLYEYDFNTSTERALTHGPVYDLNPTYSPDGKLLAFTRNRREVHVLTLATLKDTVAATSGKGYLEDALAWSPDSQWVAFVSDGLNDFANLHVVQAAGGSAGSEPTDHPITFLANGETGSKIAWSPDGKYILFDTTQRAEPRQIARVDLIPHVPSFQEDKFTELFKKQTTPGTPDTKPSPDTRPSTPDEKSTPDAPKPDAPKPDADAKPAAPRKDKKPEPTKIVFEGIRNRVTLLPLGLDAESPVISPDGKTLVFSAETAGQSNLYAWSLDELAKEPPTARQLTTTPNGKSDYAFTPDSKELFYLERGGPMGNGGAGVRTLTLEAHAAKPVAISAAIDVDFDKEKQVVFHELWDTLNRRFFDASFNGHNWAGLRDQWEPYIRGARTPVELRRDENLLIGELNSSHSGTGDINLPPIRVGRLGLRFEREPAESGRGLIVREVIPLGPAAIEGSIHPGDRLLSINGTALEPSTNLDALLVGLAGKRTVLGIESTGKKHDAVVLPITLPTETGLLYRSWVEDKRAYIDRISNGKLGYVHIAAMGDDNLNQLYLDLDAQNQSKQGVVIDVRNNNGGYVNGRVIDVFARKNYLLMTERGGEAVPSRQALGQRALGLPTVLVTNESTLSDGEDFTEGYRTLGLGKVVGVPTAGWIIFTGAQRLIDGSQVRVPGYRIRDTRGQDMEMHPRPVDLEIEQPLGETELHTDLQLQRAVDTLLTSK